MRKIARAYSVLLSLLMVAGLIAAHSSIEKGDAAVLLRSLALVAGLSPLALGAITLGPKKHRWARIALLGNQVLSVGAAAVFAWATMTPGERAGAYGMVLLGSVLNWMAMIESDRTRTMVGAGFGAWVLGFALCASIFDPDTKPIVTAATAGLNVMAYYMLGGGAVLGALAYGYMLMNGMVTRRKDDPDSRVKREGDLAFANGFTEESNPYALRDPRLGRAWLSGYSEAAKRRRLFDARKPP